MRVSMHQTVNKSIISQHNTMGFSFIETLVVLLLFSLCTSLVIPRLFQNKPGSVKKQFITNFKTLISETLYQAIATQKTHQIFFDLNKQEILVNVYQLNATESSKHSQFKPTNKNSFYNRLAIPSTFIIKNLYINKIDEMAQNKKVNDVYFYIVPDGTCQPVILNIIDEQIEANNNFSISINPFYSQVTEHDTFKSP